MVSLCRMSVVRKKLCTMQRRPVRDAVGVGSSVTSFAERAWMKACPGLSFLCE